MQQGFYMFKMAKYVSRLTCSYKNCVIHCRNVSPAISFFIPSRTESTLILSGRKARSSFVYINPKVDCDNQLDDVKTFQKEVKLRGLQINIQQMQNSWMKIKEAFISVQNLEIKRNYLRDLIAQLHEQENRTEEDDEKIAILSKKVDMTIAEQKKAQDVFWDLQDTVLVDLFKLPNRLDAKTPRISEILGTYGNQKIEHNLKAKSHLEIGKQLGLLEFRNPVQYYLCDEAVLFELAVLEYVGHALSDAKMFRIAGCDFSRSVTVEGVGLNHEDPWETFILTTQQNIAKNDPNKIHLVGGASMIAILNLFAKTLLNKNDFPVRCFSTGRQYIPYPDSSVNDGLFVACQSSIAQAFIAVSDPKSPEYQAAFDEIVSTTTQIYNDICDHYRVVLRSASELKHNESKRVSFELWSPYAKKYVEVGHISAYGDYLSKRLLMSFKKTKQHHWPGIISGTVVSVPRLLACTLERNPEKFEIPTKLRETSIFNGYNDRNVNSVEQLE